MAKVMIVVAIVAMCTLGTVHAASLKKDDTKGLGDLLGGLAAAMGGKGGASCVPKVCARGSKPVPRTGALLLDSSLRWVLG